MLPRPRRSPVDLAAARGKLPTIAPAAITADGSAEHEQTGHPCLDVLLLLAVHRQRPRPECQRQEDTSGGEPSMEALSPLLLGGQRTHEVHYRQHQRQPHQWPRNGIEHNTYQRHRGHKTPPFDLHPAVLSVDQHTPYSCTLIDTQNSLTLSKYVCGIRLTTILIHIIHIICILSILKSVDNF